MMFQPLLMNVCFLYVTLLHLQISFAHESNTHINRTANEPYVDHINHTEYLLYDLFVEYNLYVRPVQDVNSTISIKTKFYPISIKHYDEMDGVFSFIAVLGLEWTDTRLVWEPIMYGEVDYINLGYDKIWVPDLYCVNSATSFMPVGTAKERIGVSSDGNVVYAPGSLYAVACEGNMEKYPFDSQTCHVSLNAWNYRKGEVTLVPTSDKMYLQYLETNSMWTVVNTFAGHILNPGSVQLDFFIEIKRKSKFVTINVVVPLLFLSCLNNLVFLLVPESGERISLCITVLLSISVYLTILNETIPQSSEPVPLISYKIIADLAVSYIIMLMVTINLRLYNKGLNEKVPQHVKSIYKLLTCTCKKVKSIIPTSIRDIDDLDKPEDNTDKTQMQDDTEKDNITWRDISILMDSVCLIVFNFVTLCSFYAFLRMTYF